MEISRNERPSLSNLLPELFPIIASHLLLYATPSALLALGLTNRTFCEVVFPILYSCIILRNENDSLNIIGRILADPCLGRRARELHVISKPSEVARDSDKPYDVFTGLKKIIEGGLLPYIHTLSLYLLEDWRENRDGEPIRGFGQMTEDFWKILRIKCPRLQGIMVSGLGDTEDDAWLNDSGIYELQEMKGLTNVGIVFEPRMQVQEDGIYRLLRNVRYLSPSLHTLVLRLRDNKVYHSASPILSLHFPYLKTLILESLSMNDTAEAMRFWHRHPDLERLKLSPGGPQPRPFAPKFRWFDNDIQSGILPNLKHLEANYNDTRALAPILGQLVSLSIYESINAQIPYLLRSVLPKGLPCLRSLKIDQTPSSHRQIRKAEGAMWYETVEGKFVRSLVNAKRDITNNYMQSIVRGAPNLKELCLDLHYIYSVKLHDTIGSDLAEFGHLERLYYGTAHDYSYDLEKDRRTFRDVGRALAEKCQKLRKVVNFSSTLPYMTAKIHRNNGGEIEDVVLGDGYGTEIGYEDDPFPIIVYNF